MDTHMMNMWCTYDAHMVGAHTMCGVRGAGANAPAGGKAVLRQWRDRAAERVHVLRTLHLCAARAASLAQQCARSRWCRQAGATYAIGRNKQGGAQGWAGRG